MACGTTRKRAHGARCLDHSAIASVGLVSLWSDLSHRTNQQSLKALTFRDIFGFSLMFFVRELAPLNALFQQRTVTGLNAYALLESAVEQESSSTFSPPHFRGGVKPRATDALDPASGSSMHS